MTKRGIDSYKKEKNIHDAAESGDLEAVMELVAESPSEIWKTTEVGYFAALHFAAQNGHIDVAKFLLAQGADINRKSKSGETALHLACLKGHPDMVRLLLVKGADTTLTNFHKQGTYTLRQTALEVAEEYKFPEIVKIFEKFKVWDQKRQKEEKLLNDLKALHVTQINSLKDAHSAALLPNKKAGEDTTELEAAQNAEVLVLIEKQTAELDQFYKENTTQKKPEPPAPVVAAETPVQDPTTNDWVIKNQNFLSDPETNFLEIQLWLHLFEINSW